MGGMESFMQPLLRWLERNSSTLREREIETYLSHATDPVDLQNRIRNVEQAVLRCNRGFAVQ